LMASRFELLQRRNDVRSMLETGMPSKRIVPYLMERYELSRAGAYAMVKEASDQLLKEKDS
jgi:hypothetical protein